MYNKNLTKITKRRTIQSKRYAICSAFQKIIVAFLDFHSSIVEVEEAIHAGVHLFVTTKFFFAHFPNMIFYFPEPPHFSPQSQKKKSQEDAVKNAKNNIESYINSLGKNI